MELYQLRTFITVADVGNLTQASERLFTSQPAISAHIKALEQELNIKLFDRTPKGMRLTAHGEILVKKTQRILQAADALRIEASLLTGQLTGTVKIGLNIDAVFLQLSTLHDQLRSQYPQLKMQMMEGGSTELLDKVRRGILDATFFFGDELPIGLESTRLTEVTIVVAAANKWKDQLKEASPYDLAQLPWINPLPTCPYIRFIDALFEDVVEKPEWIADAASENTINTLLLSGIGVALVRLDEAQAWADRGLIAVWEGQSFRLPLHLAYLKKRRHDPLIHALIQNITTIFATIYPQYHPQAHRLIIQ
ncbi:MAG: LysR family transcriptional regulator [Cocleimonas sp.]|nr:LysR family transcriptional regulator [Cocleimonas sp.]